MELASQSQSTAPRPGISGTQVPVRAALSPILAVVAGLLLRLWMLKKLFQVVEDTRIYGGIAENLLWHGSYAFTGAKGILHPTLIRLPGYPLFLAMCFRIFGVGHYVAVAYVQIVLDLVACLLLADFARLVAPRAYRSGAAHCTLWLAALCPFTATYAVQPLTEGPTVFLLALSMWAVARFHGRPGWKYALVFTFAASCNALLRPDGALGAVALAPAMFLGLPRTAIPRPRLIRMTLICVVLAALPFGVWTARNWRVFHIFQPLAPRSAADPGEPVYSGWERWVGTWCLDYASTYNIYWNMPDHPMELADLPVRAFDSPAQHAETAALFTAYNRRGYRVTPEIDEGFAKLARERIAARPLRYYLWLPMGRLADMWLRPRLDVMNIDLDWWVYSRHHAETRFSYAYAALNVFYLLIALGGLFLRPRFWQALLAYMMLRSALLLTVTAPETRYTVECFPMLFVLGGVALYWVTYRVCLSVLKVKASPGSR